MIGVDWGTTSFRAFRLDGGRIVDRRETPGGVLRIDNGRFADALRAEVGLWLAEGERRILLSGMIGSRQGWQEARYVTCPVGVDEIAQALTPVSFDGAQVLLAPGLSDVDVSGVPDVMRSEEMQILGAGIEHGIACLPGTHSKWARIAGRRIIGFTTYMTGECFAALRDHTVLGRLMREGPTVQSAFDAGIARSAQPGGLLHQLFGVRTLTLSKRLAETEGASYLSGVLIGHEIRTALGDPAVRRAGREVHVIGNASLSALYARAIVTCGERARVGDENAAAHGLALVGAAARWT
jgi:2-dehydro-3-deoxygalactonokinase